MKHAPTSDASALKPSDQAGQKRVGVPQLSVPRGGGALRGIGEKFAANAFSGTASLSVPIAVSPGRAGFQPELSLVYDSGRGNGAFGLGWQVPLPSITRKTDRGLPLYDDARESDVFILAGAEDLVPERPAQGESAAIVRYQPRVEEGFSVIERHFDAASGVSWWVTISRENVTHVYGRTAGARIADPADETRIYSWLLESSSDDRGNAIHYEYKPEDLGGIDEQRVFERSRLGHAGATAQRYIKRVRYGNRRALDVDTVLDAAASDEEWLFEVVFDYGEHDRVLPQPTEAWPWTCRDDAFSSYRAGFELRTWRLCRRVLVFHRMDELGPGATLVRSTDLGYAHGTSTTYLRTVEQAGYLRLPDDGGYERRAMPPLELDYAALEIHDRVQHVDPRSLEHLREGVDGRTHQFVDLDGEGIAGVLSWQANELFYHANRGGGLFAAPRLLETRPAMADLASGRQQLLSLAGDSRLDLAQFSGPVAGFHERTATDGWTSFTPFASLPNLDWNSPDLRFVDLDGDGLADILVAEDEVFVWYPSQGREGFGAGRVVRKPGDPESGPAVVFSEPAESIHLADMSGDGLSDIVRVRNGEVCYWPALGRGRFGARVVMENAPVFDAPESFDARRLRLGDIDGTGTTDLIYLGGRGATIWFNQAGNRWSDGRTLASVPPVHGLAQVSVTDLLGTGTSCLVWSSKAPAESAAAMWYVDLLDSKKPHLLVGTRNNLGLETRVHFAPSTRFYLDDLEGGSPWATRLPFPVHVVERVETIDLVQRTRLVTRYRYRHGYYDGDEREFRGFGFVEQWDAESLSAEHGAGEVPGGIDEVDGEFRLPPVRTRTWFHTGAWLGQDEISRHFETEYYGGDAVAPRLAAAAALPGDRAAELREAARALKGKALRTEIYADDGSARAPHPYLVTQHQYGVRQLRAPGASRHGVYFAWERQKIESHYERRHADPRVAHTLALEVDAFGSVVRAASVSYPRRVPAFEEQGRLTVTLSELRVVNDTGTPWRRRLGVPVESREYEVHGLSAPLEGTFAFDALDAALKGLEVIPYEAAPSPGTPQKRLVAHTRQLYYADALGDAALPLGEIGARALPFETCQLALTPGLVAATWQGHVSGELLTSEGGYVELDGGFWIPSGREVFDAKRFYLPVRFISGFRDARYRNTGEVRYDEYGLLVREIVASDDPAFADHVVSALNDYRVLGPWQVTDINGNTTAVRFDALGMVVATAVSGKNGEGDTLDNPTTRLEYDLHAFRDRGQPVHVRTLARESHGRADTRWQESIEYSNGAGREIMTKVRVEPGKDAVPRWVGTGRTVFDNKGNAVKKYEPYFSASPAYEDEAALISSGVTDVLRYDPLGRLVRTDHPNGTFARVEFDGWTKTSWDENDTVLESAWYAARSAASNASAQEKRAAQSARKHAETPTIEHLDARGRTFLAIEALDTTLAGQVPTHTRLDLAGNPLVVTDAEGRAAFVTSFDLVNRKLSTQSIDAGDRWMLDDATGAPLRVFRGRLDGGQLVATAYDRLRRATHVTFQSGEEKAVIERTIYGEVFGDARARNLVGQVYRVYDGAGSVTHGEYDFKGKVRASGRRLARDYRTLHLDWSAETLAALDRELEGESSATHFVYDALDRVTHETTHDGSVSRPVYNEAGLLESLSIDLRGGAEQSVVRAVDYNARRQRVWIAYGNGTETHYDYDSLTFLLKRLVTKRGATVLQDLRYTYDPVGNILEIEDAAPQVEFVRGAVVPASSVYVYDALYRLVEAEGREHPGQQPTHADAPWRGLPHANDLQALERYTEQYDYDKVGNILEMRHRARKTNWTRAYRYVTGTNRLRWTSMPGDLPDSDPVRYGHDEYGNMTWMPHLPAMKWSCRDTLRQAEKKGGGTAYYTYDASGERVRKVVVRDTGLVDERVYLGRLELFRERAGDVSRPMRETLHAMDGERRVAMFETDVSKDPAPASVSRFVVENHLGSAQLELDEDGEVISYEEYHPYGTTAFHAMESRPGLSLKRYRFTGKERDEESGFSYHSARYYVPWLGRWSACDPEGQRDSLSLYVFVRGSPVGLSDPDGRKARVPRGRGDRSVNVGHLRLEYRGGQAVGLSLKPSVIVVDEFDSAHAAAAVALAPYVGKKYSISRSGFGEEERRRTARRTIFQLSAHVGKHGRLKVLHVIGHHSTPLGLKEALNKPGGFSANDLRRLMHSDGKIVIHGCQACSREGGEIAEIVRGTNLKVYSHQGGAGPGQPLDFWETSWDAVGQKVVTKWVSKISDVVLPAKYVAGYPDVMSSARGGEVAAACVDIEGTVVSYRTWRQRHVADKARKTVSWTRMTDDVYSVMESRFGPVIKSHCPASTK